MGKCWLAVWDVNISVRGTAGTFCSSRDRLQQQTQSPSKPLERKHVLQTLSSNEPEIRQEWHVGAGPRGLGGLSSQSKQDCSISPPPFGIRGFPLKSHHMACITCVWARCPSHSLTRAAGLVFIRHKGAMLSWTASTMRTAVCPDYKYPPIVLTCLHYITDISTRSWFAKHPPPYALPYIFW